MLTYVADKRVQCAKGLPDFIAVWHLHASGKKNFEDHLLNVNISVDGWTDYHKNIYLYIFILGLLRKPEKLGSHTGSRMMTR